MSLYAYGMVIGDTYWFKPKGSKLRYEDICFESDYYSEVALNGELIIYHKSPKLSPQLTAIGSFEKCWKKIDGEWWMYKKGTEEQIFSELFCSRLAKKVGIPTAEYEYKDGCIRTRNFADRYNFEPMSALVGEDENYETIFNALLCIDEDLAKEYLRLMYFDCLINNIDRHNENLGVLRIIETGQIISMAPNFDNNLALLGWDKNLRINPSSDGLIKSFMRFLKKNEIASRMYKKIKLAKISRDMIRQCLAETDIEMKDYDICEYIMSRYDYLMKARKGL